LPAVRRLICCIASVTAKPSFNRLSCAGVAWFQIVDFERLQRDESMQGIEFLGIAQLFREHDLADLFFNGHGLILPNFD
jgi:hypothetical protein